MVIIFVPDCDPQTYYARLQKYILEATHVGKMRLRAEKAPLSRAFVETIVDNFSDELENIKTTSRVNLVKNFFVAAMYYCPGASLSLHCGRRDKNRPSCQGGRVRDTRRPASATAVS